MGKVTDNLLPSVTGIHWFPPVRPWQLSKPKKSTVWKTEERELAMKQMDASKAPQIQDSNCNSNFLPIVHCLRIPFKVKSLWKMKRETSEGLSTYFLYSLLPICLQTVAKKKSAAARHEYVQISKSRLYYSGPRTLPKAMRIRLSGLRKSRTAWLAGLQ